MTLSFTFIYIFVLFFVRGEMSFWKSVFCSESEAIGFLYVNLLTKGKKV